MTEPSFGMTQMGASSAWLKKVYGSTRSELSAGGTGSESRNEPREEWHNHKKNTSKELEGQRKSSLGTFACKRTKKLYIALLTSSTTREKDGTHTHMHLSPLQSSQSMHVGILYNTVYPRHCMYAIYAYIDPPNHPNVGIYDIHGVSGI